MNHDGCRGSTATRARGGKGVQGLVEVIQIRRHVGWQLQEDGPEVRAELTGANHEPVHRLARLLQPSDVGEVPTGLHGEQEPGWHPGSPRAECLGGGHPIERDVQLDGIELLRIPLQLRASGGWPIEPATPMLVEKAGGADSDRHVCGPRLEGWTASLAKRRCWTRLVACPLAPHSLQSDAIRPSGRRRNTSDRDSTGSSSDARMASLDDVGAASAGGSGSWRARVGRIPVSDARCDRSEGARYERDHVARDRPPEGQASSSRSSSRRRNGESRPAASCSPRSRAS